jgi:hypothetical protein
MVEVGSNSTKTCGGHDIHTDPESARQGRFFGALFAKKFGKLAKLRTFKHSIWGSSDSLLRNGTPSSTIKSPRSFLRLVRSMNVIPF